MWAVITIICHQWRFYRGKGANFCLKKRSILPGCVRESCRWWNLSGIEILRLSGAIHQRSREDLALLASTEWTVCCKKLVSFSLLNIRLSPLLWWSSPMNFPDFCLIKSFSPGLLVAIPSTRVSSEGKSQRIGSRIYQEDCSPWCHRLLIPSFFLLRELFHITPFRRGKKLAPLGVSCLWCSEKLTDIHHRGGLTP